MARVLVADDDKNLRLVLLTEMPKRARGDEVSSGLPPSGCLPPKTTTCCSWTSHARLGGWRS